MAIVSISSTILNSDGTALNGALVTVRDPDTASKAAIFTDATGATPLANPVTTSATGVATFFAEAGTYNLSGYDAFKNEFTKDARP